MEPKTILLAIAGLVLAPVLIQMALTGIIGLAGMILATLAPFILLVCAAALAIGGCVAIGRRHIDW